MLPGGFEGRHGRKGKREDDRDRLKASVDNTGIDGSFYSVVSRD